jgi:hypothetical protein
MFSFFDKKRFQTKQQKPAKVLPPRSARLPLSARLWAFFKPGTPYTFTDLPELQVAAGNQAVTELVGAPLVSPSTSSPPVPATGTSEQGAQGSPGPEAKSERYNPTKKQEDASLATDEDQGQSSYINQRRLPAISQEEMRAKRLLGIKDEAPFALDPRELAKERGAVGEGDLPKWAFDELKGLQALSKDRWGFEAALRVRQGLEPLKDVPSTKAGPLANDFPMTKGMPEGETFLTTHYMSPMEAERYKLVIQSGKLYRRLHAFRKDRDRPSAKEPGADIGKPQMAKKWELEPYDTGNSGGSLHGDQSEAGSALYVMSSRGDIYSGSDEVYWRHHSSFLAGADVAAAGMIKVTNGQIEWVSNSSGHYEPEPKFLNNILDLLEKNNVDLSKITVKEDRNSECPLGSHRDYSATIWRQKHNGPPRAS